MAKKIPSNFYQEVNVRKLNNVFDSGLPSIGSGDNGKVVKVVDNKFALSEDLHTTVVANPEGSSTDELMNLKVGDTIYAVNKPTFEYIKGIRLTISDGGQYRTDKPKVEFYDDAGNVVTTPTYTSSCDKEYAGNISLNQVCSIATTDAPGVFTYVFDNTMPVTINHLIKLTNAGAFAGDIAKSVKVELTSDGENWLELWFDPSIAWSGSSNAYRIIDIKTGEVSNTLLPIVTSADNGKVLGVVSGVWDKTDIPKELPTVTSADNGLYLEVVNGAWAKQVPLTEGDTIPTKGRVNLSYISYIDLANSIYDIDLSDRIDVSLDTIRYADTTNLKVTIMLNNTLIASNANFDNVFEPEIHASEPQKLYINTTGRIGGLFKFKPAYAALVPQGTQVRDFVYFKFVSDIVLGEAD